MNIKVMASWFFLLLAIFSTIGVFVEKQMLWIVSMAWCLWLSHVFEMEAWKEQHG